LVATGFSRWLRVGFRFLARFSALLALGFSLARKIAENARCLAKQRLKPRPRSPAKAGWRGNNRRVPPAEAGGNQIQPAKAGNKTKLLGNAR
jgi:hypothetical protein